MKIGVTQIVLGRMGLNETLELCEEAGYEALELVFSPGKDLDVQMSEPDLAKVAMRCEGAGVEITSVIANLPGAGKPPEPRRRGEGAVPPLRIAGAGDRRHSRGGGDAPAPGTAAGRGYVSASLERSHRGAGAPRRRGGGTRGSHRTGECLEQIPAQSGRGSPACRDRGQRTGRDLSRYRQHDGLRVPRALDPRPGTAHRTRAPEGLRPGRSTSSSISGKGIPTGPP